MSLIDEVRKREFNIFEIFAISKGIYKSRFKPILDISIFLGLPINILLAFVSISAANLGQSLNFEAIMNNPELFTQFLESEAWRNIGLYYLLLVVIQSMVLPLVTMAAARISEDFLMGKTTSSKEAVKESFSNGAVLIFASLIHEIFIFCGTTLFVIPGLIFYVMFYFYVYAIALDGKGVLSSLSFSKSLVKGMFLKTAIAVVIIFTVNYSLSYIINFAFSFFGVSMFTEAIAGVVRTLMDCYFVVVITVYYINRKAVKDGIAQKNKGVI